MRILFWVSVTTAAFAALAGAGPFGLSLGVSVFTPPEGDGGLSPLYKAGLYYFWTKKIETELEVGYAVYGADGVNYNYVPVTLRGIYHFRFKPNLDPYLGAGAVHGRKWWDGDEPGDKNTWGYSALTGARITVARKYVLGAGIEYVVPDAGDVNSSYPAVSLSLGAGTF